MTRKAQTMMTMIGIDPHKATHTAVAIDNDERVLKEVRVRACAGQVERLRDWAAGFQERAWAIESACTLRCSLIGQQAVDHVACFDLCAAVPGEDPEGVMGRVSDTPACQNLWPPSGHGHEDARADGVKK